MPSTPQFTKKHSFISAALPEPQVGGLTPPFYGSELGMEAGEHSRPGNQWQSRARQTAEAITIRAGGTPWGSHTTLPLGRLPTSQPGRQLVSGDQGALA